MERALSFGRVASAYERFRPGYPDQLVDEVLRYARTPIRTALEIGAGTGKATRAFATRGIALTATDPDAAMLSELRKHVPPTVSTTHVAFEDLSLGSTYDLVFAAAAMHWTEPAHRWSRVNALLNENGVFASFGGQLHLDDPAVEEAVRTVRGQFLPDDEVPSPDGTPDDGPMQWPATELSRSGLFTDIRQTVIKRRVMMSAEEYLGHLSTISAYLQLSAVVRAEVINRVMDVLPAHVTLNADLTLHLARVVGRSDTWWSDRLPALARICRDPLGRADERTSRKRDTEAMDEDELTRAVVLWTGWGTRSWPHRDDAALVREFGEARGLDLLMAVRSLEGDFYSSEARLTDPNLQGMGDRAAAEFRSRHPDAHSALVDALAWCYSFDYK